MKILFSVRDNKAGFFLPPFLLISEGEAIRAFEEATLNTQSPISQHPEDYTLFSLGHFDEVSGEITPNPISLLAGLNALQNIVNSRKIVERIKSIDGDNTNE